MCNGHFGINEHHQFVPEPILSDSATNAIEFHVQDFFEGIQYVLPHKGLCFTTNRQMETTKKNVKKFFTNLVGQIRYF